MLWFNCYQNSIINSTNFLFSMGYGIMSNKIYIASRAKNGGIYSYEYIDGIYEKLFFTQMDSPMYMIMSDKKMHILLRAPFDNSESGLISYDVAENGELVNSGEILSTKGEVACHLTEIDNCIYCVNYTSGSVIKIPDNLVVHKGNGVSHTHYVGAAPDNKYIFVTDLGLDEIYLYDKNLILFSKIKMPVGHGVRHLVVSKDGKYVFTANELKSTVSVLRYANGNMELLDTIKTIYGNKKSAPSAIRLYGEHIFVANRFHNSISKISFNGSKLSLEDNFSCMGKTPRDFIFDDNRIICANQDGNSVTVFCEQADTSFKHTQTINMVEPICII